MIWATSLVLVLLVLLGLCLGRRPASAGPIGLRAGLATNQRMTVHLEGLTIGQAQLMYAELTGRTLVPRTNDLLERLDDLAHERLSRWHLIRRQPRFASGIEYHRDGYFSALEVKETLESFFKRQGLVLVPEGYGGLRIVDLRSSRGRSLSSQAPGDN